MPIDFDSEGTATTNARPPLSKPAVAPTPPVQWATASQKEEIIRLLNHPMITRQEKTKMLLNLNRFTDEYAVNCIRKMRNSIQKRESGEEQIPQYVPEPVDERVYSFYQLQRCASEEVKMRDRVYRSRIQNQKMTQEKADSETEMMGRLATIMHYLSNGTLKLIHVDSGAEVYESRPGSFEQFIDIT